MVFKTPCPRCKEKKGTKSYIYLNHYLYTNADDLLEMMLVGYCDFCELEVYHRLKNDVVEIKDEDLIRGM